MSNPRPYAQVICYEAEIGCGGFVPLTKEQYDQQMMRPNQTWRCPRCLSEAEWDDFYWEQAEKRRLKAAGGSGE